MLIANMTSKQIRQEIENVFFNTHSYKFLIEKYQIKNKGRFETRNAIQVTIIFYLGKEKKITVARLLLEDSLKWEEVIIELKSNINDY